MPNYKVRQDLVEIATDSKILNYVKANLNTNIVNSRYNDTICPYTICVSIKVNLFLLRIFMRE